MTNIQVYVGTYAKYNNGSIQGKWLDLSAYNDETEFLEACAALHSDESDPEFMFQDYEGFPSEFYSESGLSADLWDWLALSDDDREVLTAFIECVGSHYGATLEMAQEAYRGEYASEIDFAYDFVEDCGFLKECPTELRDYFDYEAYARDLFLNGYSLIDGKVFLFS